MTGYLTFLSATIMMESFIKLVAISTVEKWRVWMCKSIGVDVVVMLQYLLIEIQVRKECCTIIPAYVITFVDSMENDDNCHGLSRLAAKLGGCAGAVALVSSAGLDTHSTFL